MKPDVQIPLPLLPREDCHVLPLSLPKLRGKDAGQALGYKLRGVFPGYREDLPYYPWWSPPGFQPACLVIIPREGVFPQAPERIRPGFPLLAPPGKTGDLVMLHQVTRGTEVHLYARGRMVQSHFLPKDGADPEDFLKDIIRRHPGTEILRTGSGAAPPASPVLGLKALPEGSWAPAALKAGITLAALLFVFFRTSALTAALDREIQELKQASAALSSELRPQNPADRKKQETRVKELETLSGIPVLAILQRIETRGTGHLRLTALSLRDGTLRMEGETKDTMAAWNHLREDPWFADLKPESIRKDPGTGLEFFRIQGRLIHD